MDNPDPNRLARVPLFEGLTEEELQRLAGWFTVERFDVGRSPVQASQHGYAFFVLDEGTARVSSQPIAPSLGTMKSSGRLCNLMERAAAPDQ